MAKTVADAKRANAAKAKPKTTPKASKSKARKPKESTPVDGDKFEPPSVAEAEQGRAFWEKFKEKNEKNSQQLTTVASSKETCMVHAVFIHAVFICFVCVCTFVICNLIDSDHYVVSC